MCGIVSDVLYPNIEGKDDGQGSGTESEAIKSECRGRFTYRGTQNKTNSGRTCQRWDSQEPHPHEYTREFRPYAGLSENYCRNPSGDSQNYPWCYTTDPAVKYDYCNVPWCQLDWCKLSGKEFLSGLELKFDTLHRAKRNCGWKGDDCSGITQLIDGTYGLTTGVLYPTDKPVYGLTLQKGACKKFDPPVGVYCEVKDVKLTGYYIPIRTKKSKSGSVASLLEAKQLCTYMESCKGISGKDGAYYLYTHKIFSKVSGVDSWLKGECPDVTKCGTGSQADYRGNISTTASGKTCQRWDSQTPHSHTRTPDKYPDSGLEENFCRNPDGEGLYLIFSKILFSFLSILCLPLSSSLPFHVCFLCRLFIFFASPFLVSSLPRFLFSLPPPFLVSSLPRLLFSLPPPFPRLLSSSSSLFFASPFPRLLSSLAPPVWT